jgi:hypothetical protein
LLFEDETWGISYERKSCAEHFCTEDVHKSKLQIPRISQELCLDELSVKIKEF